MADWSVPSTPTLSWAAANRQRVDWSGTTAADAPGALTQPVITAQKRRMEPAMNTGFQVAEATLKRRYFMVDKDPLISQLEKKVPLWNDQRPAAERVADLITMYRPKGTADNYARYEKQFWEWVKEKNIEEKEKLVWPSRPIPAAVLIDWLHWLVSRPDKPLAVGTMKVAASAVANMHTLCGLESPNTMSLVKLAKKVLSQHFGKLRPVKRRAPYTPDMLRKMMASINGNAAVDVRNWCMILLSIVFGLRGSNVVALRDCDVWWQDIPLGDGRMERVLFVHLQQSKTDQEGKGETRVAAVAPADQRWMCAYSWLMQWRLWFRNAWSPMLFHSCKHASDVKEIKRETFYHAIKELVAKSGYDPSLYGTHSGRVTFATFNGAAGTEERLIKVSGGWASDAVRVYIRESISKRLVASRAIYRIAQQEQVY